MKMEEHVILVDSQNKSIGTMEKLEAHRKGLLHRAFSIFIFNSQGEMLIHQRASEKYHCGELWTNACCSHPRPGEKREEALNRKLKQEMGFVTPVEKAFDFTYRAVLSNGLVEHEFDEVYFGIYEGSIHPNPAEVMSFKYQDPALIKKEMLVNPAKFTPWFRMLIDPVTESYKLFQRA